jgi:hypothetical protein
MLNKEKLNKEKLNSKKLNSKKLNKEKLDKEKESVSITRGGLLRVYSCSYSVANRCRF